MSIVIHKHVLLMSIAFGLSGLLIAKSAEAGNAAQHRRRVVNVDPPTGVAADDVASIEAAVAAATPGAVIRFQSGTYQLEVDTQIEVSTSGVRLQGAVVGGTTIRGVAAPIAGPLSGYFWMTGDEQTVRDLDFVDFPGALSFGRLTGANATGGHRVEGCTFEHGFLAIDYVSASSDPTVIRKNYFVDMVFNFFVIGSSVHFRQNVITVLDPTRIITGRPFNAGQITAFSFTGVTICENNVIEHNTVIGNADGFFLAAREPGVVCRNNLIRKNRFFDQRLYGTTDNGTMVFLDAANGGVVEDNDVLGNVLKGSQGIGVIVRGATSNRIIGNYMTDLPGTEIPAEAVTGSALPGAGIYLDPNTASNEVTRNRFKNVLNPIVDLGTNNVHLNLVR